MQIVTLDSFFEFVHFSAQGVGQRQNSRRAHGSLVRVLCQASAIQLKSDDINVEADSSP